jgi:hypothetical protein
MTDDELDRLRISLSHAHEAENAGFFLSLVERMRAIYHGPSMQPMVTLPQSQGKSNKDAAVIGQQ